MRKVSPSAQTRRQTQRNAPTQGLERGRRTRAQESPARPSGRSGLGVRSRNTTNKPSLHERVNNQLRRNRFEDVSASHTRTFTQNPVGGADDYGQENPLSGGFQPDGGGLTALRPSGNPKNEVKPKAEFDFDVSTDVGATDEGKEKPIERFASDSADYFLKNPLGIDGQPDGGGLTALRPSGNPKNEVKPKAEFDFDVSTDAGAADEGKEKPIESSASDAADSILRNPLGIYGQSDGGGSVYSETPLNIKSNNRPRKTPALPIDSIDSGTSHGISDDRSTPKSTVGAEDSSTKPLEDSAQKSKDAVSTKLDEQEGNATVQDLEDLGTFSTSGPQARKPFLNGDKAHIAILDFEIGQKGGHGEQVKDVLEVQLGADGKNVYYRSFDVTNRSYNVFDYGRFSEILTYTKNTGKKFDYINMSFVLGAPDPKDDPNNLGELYESVNLYNRHVGESNALQGSYEDWSSEQRRALADFIQDFTLSRIWLSPEAQQYTRKNSVVFTRIIGDTLQQGRELMRQGTSLVFAAGNQQNELSALTLLREYNHEWRDQGQAISVGAIDGQVLENDNVYYTENGQLPRDVASWSSRRGVDVYANGNLDRTIRQPGSSGSGTSIAVPEFIATLVKQQSQTEDLYLHLNVSKEEQRRLIG